MQSADTDNLFITEPAKFSSPNNQFWTLQVCGWLGYFVFVFLAIIHPQFDDPQFNFSGQMLNLGVETGSGFLLSSFQWLLIRRFVHLPLNLTLMISFTSAAIIGCVFNLIKLASYKTLVHHQVWYEQLDMLEFGGWLLFSLTTMFAFTAIFFIMLYNSRLQKEHEMLLRAQNSVKESQLQMLRYQLNPHFMFNTLNAISTLIYKSENEKANEMLDKLCSFFRHSLDQTGAQATSLKEELQLLELYLSIEKVRFGERLQVNLDIDPDAYRATVPNMLLQPMVENAIKYGIESQKGEGKIDVIARVKNRNLLIEVIDNGSGKNDPNTKGFGIGLRNTRERLNTLFNNDCSLELTQVQDVGAKAIITMPFVNT